MKDLLGLLPSGRPLAVFLDYDGTLVPIRRRPDLARLSPGHRDKLARLGRATRIAIVSGRPLAEIRRLVGIPGLAYIGNHGLEIRANGRTWVHSEASRRARDVTEAVAALKDRTRQIRGVLVEHKGLTASLHLRMVAPRHHPALRALASDVVRQSGGDLVLRRGKCVLELRPSIPWDKGRGVLRLLGPTDGRRLPFPIYIGDDQTDEDGFRAVRELGLTIRVGSGGRTMARHRLPGVENVWAFLGAVARLLDASPSPRPRARWAELDNQL